MASQPRSPQPPGPVAVPVPLEPPGEHAADRRLAAAAAGGDREARRALVDRLLGRSRALVQYLTSGHRDAEDLLQDALVAVLHSVGSYRGLAPLEWWSDRIVVRRTVRSLGRRRAADRALAFGDDLPGEVAPDQLREAGASALRERLLPYLARLTPDQRTAVVLHWTQGYTIPEIAELTDTALDTIRDRLRVAKARLRDWLLRDPVFRAWAEEDPDDHGSV